MGASAAAALGHEYVGLEHLLLELLDGKPDDAAQAALVAAGVIAGDVRRHLEPGGATSRWLTPNPRWYGLMGRAEGLALALGDGIVRSTEVLLAALWDDGQVAVFDLAGGTTRRAVAEALAATGARLPRVALPVPPEWSEPVSRLTFPSDDLDAVLEAMNRRHPDGLHWGWNTNGAERAWVDAEDGVDLEAVVADLGPQAEVERRSRP